MKLTPNQIETVTEILNSYPNDNVKEIDDKGEYCRIFVASITRSQLIKLDVFLENRGIAITANDESTIKLIL